MEKPSYEELEAVVVRLQRESLMRGEAEAALQRSNEILNNILYASPIGIGLAEGRRIQWVNEAMTKMFGFTRESDYREKSTRIIYPSDRDYERVGDVVYRDLSEGKSAEVDTTFQRMDGTLFAGHLKISSPDPANPMRSTIFTISDESWRERAENDRIMREKLQGVLELAGAICHELNQPLMAVSGYAELGLLGMDKGDPLYKKLDNIKLQIERMGNITKNLMRITRYETMDYSGGKRIIDIDRAST